MNAANIVWELSTDARAWVGLTEKLPDLDRQFSRCFPLLQTLIDIDEERHSPDEAV
ncbi:hypothetical protein [Pantoea eucrina]|uniref:hypothetical protein n=1 Tax=Pantoea eucrina TaxID=472693 RepID=UPI0014289F32|nr:hypothetical protein [Pantoea eucrina]